MDNLIDKTDFTGLIALVGMGNDWNSDDLDEFITHYQEKLLKQFLGEDLYNALDDNYNALTDDKWYKLVNGDTYEKVSGDKSYTIKYKGVKGMLAYFIYTYYKNDLATKTTGGGEVVSSYENSQVSKVDRKSVRAFNLGVDLLGEIKESEIDYVHVGDFPFFLKNLSANEYVPNLYNYITFKNSEDSDTYPNWIFKPMYKINEFGI